MKVRLVVPKIPYRAAKNRPEEPLTAEVRALLGTAAIPTHYVEIVPDKKGGLRVREPEKADE